MASCGCCFPSAFLATLFGARLWCSLLSLLLVHYWLDVSTPVLDFSGAGCWLLGPCVVLLEDGLATVCPVCCCWLLGPCVVLLEDALATVCPESLGICCCMELTTTLLQCGGLSCYSYCFCLWLLLVACSIVASRYYSYSSSLPSYSFWGFPCWDLLLSLLLFSRWLGSISIVLLHSQGLVAGCWDLSVLLRALLYL